MKFLAYFICCLLTPSLANAAKWSMAASVNQDVSYDDNATMKEKAQDSIIYKLTPTVKFDYETDKTVAISALASSTIERYSEIKAFDTESQKYNLNGAYSTERSVWALKTALDIKPLRNDAEEDSGDFASNDINTTWSVAPSVLYDLTERDLLKLQLKHSKTSVSSVDAPKNNEKSDIGFTWEHKFTERYQGSLNLFYSSYDSESVNKTSSSDSYGVEVTNAYDWTENLKLTGKVGIRFTDSENTTENILTKKSSRGFLVDLGIKYNGENYSANLNVNRSLVPSITTGDLNEQNSIKTGFKYDITERLSTDAAASYQRSESVSNDDKTIRENITFGTGIKWEMTQEWNIAASYRYRQQDRNTQDKAIDSNLFMLSINYNWQGLRFSR